MSISRADSGEFFGGNCDAFFARNSSEVGYLPCTFGHYKPPMGTPSEALSEKGDYF